MKNFLAIIAVVSMLAAGCAENQMHRADIEHGPLQFVKDGVATREQILLKLGEPTGQFEGGRILTYRLSPDAHGGVVVVPRERITDLNTQNDRSVQWHLVLVFTGQTLTRHALVATSESPPEP